MLQTNVMGHGFVTRCYLFATAARVRLVLLLYSVVGYRVVWGRRSVSGMLSFMRGGTDFGVL